jgi:tRNA nucleotidyltransferase/poly(A) polymerase
MGYKSGEIYFVREKVGQGYSPHVKIGLVHAPRISLDRLPEHQTGNPRILHIDRSQVVKTDAVDRVEAQLHKIFAPKRVSGEWFELPKENDLNEAISRAKELANEVGLLVPIFNAADELSQKESAETIIPASDEALALSSEIAKARGELAVCEELEALIAQKLKEAIEDDKGVVKGAATVVTVNYKPKFMKDAFESENPDLYAKYLDDVSTWSQTFRLKAKKLERSSLDQEFIGEVERIQAQIDSVTSVEEAYLLNEPQLFITNLMALSSWNEDISIAKLKVLCGTNAGIENICTWARKKGDPKSVFNEKKFVAENPELYLDYMAEEKSGTYVRVAKRKA